MAGPWDSNPRPLPRQKMEIKSLKAFACFAFPVLTISEKAPKLPSFSDEFRQKSAAFPNRRFGDDHVLCRPTMALNSAVAGSPATSL